MNEHDTVNLVYLQASPPLSLPHVQPSKQCLRNATSVNTSPDIRICFSRSALFLLLLLLALRLLL